MRGWSSPGHLGSEVRGAGVLAVNGAAAFKAGFVPDDEAPTLGSASNPRWRRNPSSTTRPKRPQVPRPSSPCSGDSPARVPARRIERARCPKRRRSARAACSTAPRHAENTAETRQKHQDIARFLRDTQATEALIASVLDTSDPTTPSTGPAKNTQPSETTRRGPRTSLLAATATGHRRRIPLLVRLSHLCRAQV